MITASSECEYTKKMSILHTSSKSYCPERNKKKRSLQTPNSGACGEPHDYGFFKNIYVFIFLFIWLAIHSARASKLIRTLIYSTYAYVAGSPKSLRTQFPMENRPYGAHRHSVHNQSRLPLLAPSPAG